MDTKLKGNRRRGRMLSILLVLLPCLVFMAAGAAIYGETDAAGRYYSQRSFVAALYKGSYGLYWKLQQQISGDVSKSPAEVFYPGLPPQNADGQAGPQEEAGGDGLQELALLCNDHVSGWYESLNNAYGEMDYLIANEDGTHTFGRNESGLRPLLAEQAPAGRQARGQSPYYAYIVLQFDGAGNVSLADISGIPSSAFDALQSENTPEDELLSALGQYATSYSGNFSAAVRGLLQKPAHVTCAFAIPQAAVQEDMVVWSAGSAMAEGGFVLLYWVLALCSGLFGLAAAAVRRLDVGGWWPARMPLEVSAAVAAVHLLVSGEQWQVYMMARCYGGSLLAPLAAYGAPQALLVFMGYGLSLFLLALCFGGIYFAAASLWQVRTLGIKQYLLTRVWAVRLACWGGRRLKRLWGWLVRIDLTDRYNLFIVKLLLANLLVLVVLSAFWVFGIPLLVVYSVLLFFMARRYAGNIKSHYGKLLQAARQMAAGRLDVRIEGDVGLFEPLKETLEEVQEGFARAVEAEIRSQNMKTELITNVSHDLKTPLTAIITYIGLLKKEDIAEEDRKSYIETLDRKSQRLKRLIEDLFEMSKAASRDITLNLSPIDLPQLLRQVELEARGELEQNGIEFRCRFPDKKIVLDLDSDKTSRIFENLVINVAKYALPGSRAYVLLRQQAGSVYIEMKNVSKAELDFDSEEITERFIRGDASRSSEGSGLGLAIAKSFTEAQGGSFQIAVDGDVFKAILRFPYLQAAETPTDTPGESGDTGEESALSAR